MDEGPLMTTTLDVLTFNLNNPGRERAERQLAYLAARPEPVLVLTETADSAGCDLLATRFESAGYSVTFPRPKRGERGVMIVSRLATKPGPAETDYLPHRCVSVTVHTTYGSLDVIGLYVPSRDATEAKTDRKRTFLEQCQSSLPQGWGYSMRVVIGDFNILEPTHTPRYRFFQPFEYGFYEFLRAAGYQDAFRALHPDELEYSWVGRTGDGYRYDHAHVSEPLAAVLHECSYTHDVRIGDDRLTDHSALSVSLAVRPTTPLTVVPPLTVAAEPAPALF
ncbi:endonuclease/exonuclease/phosphatase [Streptomyces afghaniensis]|uniref:endonuclease/exonuclease/phosphatase n=1 Tax=Streptomyces afghaniensis TaxID=66865 RepID=UPI0027890DAC|nr:endonuclease/exonuclease/phosphatase [Streptomyces afghaniensis]MDQ1019004.1 exodeoxyribonuclease-3 [Streptomyces afghaniensis]